MKSKDVLEAAEVMKAIIGAKSLRATIKGGKHELRLYALTEKETMDNEIAVTDKGLAQYLLDRVIVELTDRLKTLGVIQ